VIETPIQHFFVARHGDYDGSPRANPPLSDGGKIQARRLGEAIRAICGELPMTILCSPSQRTLETAMAVGALFKKEPVPDRCFWADDDHSENLETAMKLALACETPVLVVVTHADVTRDLPRVFGKRVIEEDFVSSSASYGRAWHLELPTTKLQLINT
jgi:phosphohistidine phosphatase SixA